mgnify:CR=1 FL=1
MSGINKKKKKAKKKHFTNWKSKDKNFSSDNLQPVRAPLFGFVEET